MTAVTAILGSSGERVAVDPDRLVWHPGYPSHDGKTWLQHAHWSRHWDSKQEVRLASLHGAIVRDAVSQLVIDAPGVCHYDRHTAEYGYVPTRRTRSVAAPWSCTPLAWRPSRPESCWRFSSMGSGSPSSHRPRRRGADEVSRFVVCIARPSGRSRISDGRRQDSGKS